MRPPNPFHPTRAWLWVGITLLPAAALGRGLAFAFPDLTERWYGRGLYPLVSAGLGALNGLVAVSLAELLAIGLLVLMGLLAWREGVRMARDGRGALQALRARAVRLIAGGWVLAGILAWAFLLLWGLNYSRPQLRQRMGLDAEGVTAKEVLALGEQAAAVAASLYRELGFDPARPTRMPISFAALNRIVDRGLASLELPGDEIGSGGPAKRLWGSVALAYLGISGIYIPFTGEPSVNALVPDVSMPLVVAHEKAHFHGVTDEGEAGMVGILVCAGAEEPYLRYAAYLNAAARLISQAARYLPQEAASVWQSLGEGPLRDLQAIEQFWARYRGPATEVARRVNDAYLRSNRVPGGVESYGRVVRLLVALHRQGRFPELGATGPGN